MSGPAPPERVELTHPSALLDHYRVPYVVRTGSDAPRAVRVARLEGGAPDGRRVVWVDAAQLPSSRRYSGPFATSGHSVAGHVARSTPADLGLGGDWSATAAVTDADGRVVAHMWESASGDVFVPFDLDRVLEGLWSEAYLTLTRSRRLRSTLRRFAVNTYYVLRPALPRAVQIRLRRGLARRQEAPAFPAWPLETGMHDLCEWFLRTLAETLGVSVPYIAPWPAGSTWALVLTHDVETAAGCRDMELLRAGERAAGLRSSWNFVPERYDVTTALLDRVRADGCEVGVHGLRHDGRDLASRRQVRLRSPRMRDFARRWQAVGFRSPATQRGWDLMPLLGFEYDSSYSDTDPYEPQPGGSCTYLPFFNGDLVELPITLPQDHTLFEILGHRDGSLWLGKADQLRRRGGMVLVLTHPDYAHGPALSAWQDLLDLAAADDQAWNALPREVATWWRDRRRTEIVAGAHGWELRGPAAARARIDTVAPQKETAA